MVEDSNNGTYIGQLNIRMPGDSPESAHRVADGIARGLGQRIPAQCSDI